VPWAAGLPGGLRLLAAIGTLVMLQACSGSSPSALKPKGPGAERIAGLWWFMFWTSAVVVVVVTALIVLAVRPRRRPRRDDAAPPTLPTEHQPPPRWSRRLVILGGAVIPAVILAVLWGLTLHDMAALSEPARPGALRVEVVGYRWWWAVRYPQQGVVTANEVHIPTGRRVELTLRSRDVIHSFWVPQLQGKTDLIPGVTNHMWIQADRAGIYRGQCAEYCGLQHANMIFYVVAQPPAEFDRWLANEQAPPATPTGLAARGEQVFLTSSCVACHTVQGTVAEGTVGPNLTHFGSRLYLGAGVASNDPGNLATWIVDSQSLKPGNRMPPQPLSPSELRAVMAYLRSLK
jgi:cytochrome c oxidase subunit 2